MSFEIRGRQLARNTAFNLIGQGVPLIVGVVTIPPIVRGLGTERFGLLSLVWVIFGYFTIFDLGLSRATTKFVAEALGKGDRNQLSKLVWTAASVQGLLAILAVVVLIAITPLVVERILNIPTALIEEATATFYVLAGAVPVVMVAGSFSGVLEARQRFDLVNAVRIPSGILAFILPLVGIASGLSLTGIVALIVISRVLALLALVAFALRLIPSPRVVSPSLAIFPRLLSYGGWITISNIVTLFLRHFNRFVIGTLLSLTAVAYYSAPADILLRLWIIPSSLVLTLFPAFSALIGAGQLERRQELFVRSVKYLIVSAAPLVFLLVVFAEAILGLWLGQEFAQNSALVFQILALGTLVTIPAFVPLSVTQASGRADIIAKFYLVFAPISVVLDWQFVTRLGLQGAALSFGLKSLIDTSALFMIGLWVIRMPANLFARRILPAAAVVTVMGLLIGLGASMGMPLFPQVVLNFAMIAVFAVSTWYLILGEDDRIAIRSMLGMRQ
ncbi:MAG: flippase [Anaerolineales bacterium]